MHTSCITMSVYKPNGEGEECERVAPSTSVHHHPLLRPCFSRHSPSTSHASPCSSLQLFSKAHGWLCSYLNCHSECAQEYIYIYVHVFKCVWTALLVLSPHPLSVVALKLMCVYCFFMLRALALSFCCFRVILLWLLCPCRLPRRFMLLTCVGSLQPPLPCSALCLFPPFTVNTLPRCLAFTATRHAPLRFPSSEGGGTRATKCDGVSACTSALECMCERVLQQR